MSFPKYPAYKDSGVEWLGVVPEHWTVTLLKRGYEVVLGKMLQPEAKRDDDELLSYLRAANIQPFGIDVTDVKKMWFGAEEKKSLLLRRGDLLVSEGGDVGRSAIWDMEGEYYFQNSINRIRSIVGNDTRFLYFWMTDIKSNGYIDVLCNKSTIAHFTAEKVATVPLLLPSKIEQTQIARFLNHETARIDALIEEQQRLIELLKEKRQAVISHAVTKGLDPTVPMKASGVEWLGEVPAHWGVRKFYFGVKAIIDNRGRSPSYEDSGIPILEARQLSDDAMECSLDFSKYISEESHSEFVRDDVAPGDVLMVTVGSIGKVGLVGESPEYVILQNIVGFRVGSDIEPGFMGIYLKSGAAFMAMQATNKESILSSVKVSDFIQHKMPLPPLAEQKAIVSLVNIELSKYGELQKEAELLCSTLNERRSALISAAVTGKIDVRNWQPPAKQYPVGDNQNRTELEAV